MVRKRCLCCGRWYRPDARAARVQKSCALLACRAQRRLRKQRSWLKRHPGYGASRRPKIRAWAAEYVDYWRQYRADNAEYRERERRRMRLKRRGMSRVAKQTEIGQILVEKLRMVKAGRPETVAKQTAIDRRVDDLVEVLIWKEAVAKQSGIERRAGGAG
jgi:hypothetical protein